MLCCVCLLEAEHTISVCDDLGKHLSIAEIISKHFWFKHNDILSSHICTICWDKIDDFHKFYEIVEKTHKEFQHIQQDLAIMKEEDNYINPESIKQEDVASDDQNSINIEKPMQLEVEIDLDEVKNTKNPLEENIENKSSDSDSDDNYSNEDGNNSTSSDEYQPDVKVEIKEENTKNTKKSMKNENKPKRCRRKKSAISKSGNNSIPKRKKAIFNRLDPVHTEEMILKHIPMGCNLCVFVGKTFSDIVTHFKAEHPDVRPYITCCDKTFTKRFYVAHVEKIHKDFEKRQTTIKEEENPSSSNIKLENEEIFEDNVMQIDVEIDKILENVEEPLNSKNPLDDGGSEKEYESLNEMESEEYELSEISDEDYESQEKTTKNVNTKNKKTPRKISQKRNTNTKSKTNIESTKKKRMSHRLDPILTEEIIKKHITMACNLCIYVGETFSDIIEHFKNSHENVKPYIMCCDKKFTRSYCIVQHAYIHENPNSFSCSECNKSFTTSYGLRIHNISYHASEEERTHACEQCPRKFGRRNLLELHRQTHIPKEQWTIVCTKCTNRTAKFATQYLLNIHTSMYHRREINICQVCAKEIKDKKAFEKHVRSHYEDSGPRLKCPIENCESWLKDEDNLKNHIQRYHLDDKTYKCPDCDRVCRNRRSLSSHKHYFHSKEVFRCEQCDKTFKKALTLKEHMTQHTGETLYNCPFCTRTFNSNANMHAHKKKQHPVEWQELRRKKLGPMPN